MLLKGVCMVARSLAAVLRSSLYGAVRRMLTLCLSISNRRPPQLGSVAFLFAVGGHRTIENITGFTEDDTVAVHDLR